MYSFENSLLLERGLNAMSPSGLNCGAMSQTEHISSSTVGGNDASFVVGVLPDNYVYHVNPSALVIDIYYF